MGSWTLEKVSGLTPLKRVSFLGSISPHSGGVLLLPFTVFWTFSCLCSAFFIEGFLFFTIYSFWVFRVLHFLCYWFCLFQGSFFSGWTPCTNQKPLLLSWWRLRIRKDRKQEKRGAEFPTIAGKHSSLRRLGQHCQDQPQGGLCQPLTCGAVKFPQGLGRGIASQRSDLAAIGEHRGSFVLGVSLILRWSSQCQQLWFKKKIKTRIDF